YAEQRRCSPLNAELAGLEPHVIATGVWWLPQVAAATVHDARWFGVMSDTDIQHVASSSERFWWVWTSEGRVPEASGYLRGAAPLPVGDYTPVLVKKLSTRDLEAVLYAVEPQGNAGGAEFRPIMST